jgi:membrane fusion protein, multidrug efflux system
MKTYLKIIFPIVGAIGIAGVIALGQVQKPSTPVAQVSGEPPKSVEVQIVAATTSPMPRYLLVTGELQADKETLVAADAMGKVLRVPIERGTVVKLGEVLVQLDDRSAKLALEEAQANQDLAQVRYDLAVNDVNRNRPLMEAHAIAASEFQHYESEQKARAAELQLAKVHAENAQQTLNDTTIRAPFSGIVSERLVQVGEYVRNDAAVARLIDIQTLRLLLNIPEPSVSGIHLDQEVSFVMSSFPNHTFTGKVGRVSPAVRNSSRDMLIEVLIDNSDNVLRPGIFASAKVRLEDVPAVTVPTAAVRKQGDSHKVFVVENGHALERLVQMGESTSSMIEIRGGLKAQESVVLAPTDELVDGAAVVTKGAR